LLADLTERISRDGLEMSLTSKFEEKADTLWEQCSSPKAEWKRMSLLFLAVTALLLLCREADLDLFTRAAVGRLVEILGTAPSTDPFSFSPTKEMWLDHEWLAGVLFWEVLQFGGSGMVLGLNILFCVLTLFFVRASQRLLAKDISYSFLLMAVAVVGSMNAWVLPIRAQAFTWLFFSIFLYIFALFRVQHRIIPLFYLPLLMVLWVNAHGGFVVGLGYVGCFALVSAWYRDPGWKMTWVAGVLCCLALFLNPYGVSFLSFIFVAVTSNVPSDLIEEWHRLPLLSSQALFLVLFLVVLGWSFFLKESGRWVEIFLMLLPGLLGGIRHQRFIPFFYFSAVVYATPAMSFALERFCSKYPRWKLLLRRSLMMSSVLGVGAAVAVFFLSFGSGVPALTYKTYPVTAIQWMKERLAAGNVLLPYDDGSYALWKLYPDFKISIDGRYDGVYSRESLALSFDALTAQGDKQEYALQMLAPDHILISKNSSSFERSAELFPDHKIAYEDDVFVVFTREWEGPPDSPNLVLKERAVKGIWVPDF
jgi:MFS family permease